MTSKSELKRLAVMQQKAVDFHEYCDHVFLELLDLLITKGIGSMKSAIPLHLGAVRRMERNGEFKKPK